MIKTIRIEDNKVIEVYRIIKKKDKSKLRQGLAAPKIPSPAGSENIFAKDKFRVLGGGSYKHGVKLEFIITDEALRD